MDDTEYGVTIKNPARWRVGKRYYAYTRAELAVIGVSCFASGFIFAIALMVIPLLNK